ncbi:MAG: tRNA pseudouridine(55) synthase TruB [Rhodovibrionaceae bacterium]|nr:tRNA pseudouridine(55) synthase TruB [Rhodovibrionaceae bacterium]
MARKRKGKPIDGWLVIDKPGGPTSAQVVNAVRRITGAAKLGHAGTLDPLATGILPVALGEATKTIAYVMEGAKRYRFTLRWGRATTTDDTEGEVLEESDRRPSREEIEAALPRFIGEIEQVPPRFSAIKVEGKRAYDLAREGEEVELAARHVRIDSLSLAAMDDADHATFHVACGKGAYMRALARDLGAALGVPAHISALRRTAVGPFDEDDAISLDSLKALGHSAAALEHVLPVGAALDDIPALALTETEAIRLRHGQSVSMLARANLERVRELSQGAIVCAKLKDQPVALAKFEAGDLRPVRVLNLQHERG